MKKYDVIIIGGGVSGLSVATLLAQKKIKCLLVEKESQLGGYLASFKRKDYRFESAVHTFCEGQPGGTVARFLKDINLQDKLEVTNLATTDKLVFPDLTLELKRDYSQIIDDLSALFPNEKTNIEVFFNNIKKFIKKKNELLIRRAFEGRRKESLEFINYIENDFNFKFKAFLKEFNADIPLKDYLNTIFRSKKLKQILLSFPPIPNSTFMTAATIWDLNLNGLYHIKGGTDKIIHELAKSYTDNEGEILLNTFVKEVVYSPKENKVSGILTENEKFYSDYIISAIDINYLFNNLFKSQQIPNEYLNRIKQDVTISNFVIYLGIKKPISSFGFNGEHVYIYPDYNIDKTYKSLSNNDYYLNSPVIVATNSANDLSFTSKDKGVLVVHTSLKYDYFSEVKENKQLYKEKKDEITKNILKILFKTYPGIEEYVDYIDSATPLTFQRYTLNKEGAIMGWQETKEYPLSPFQTNQTKINGLYLTGHWTHPGAGIPTSFLSAIELRHLLINQMNKAEKVHQ